MTQIVGLDACDSGCDSVITSTLTAHVAKLRSLACFRSAVFYIYIESNMSWVGADRLACILQDDIYQPVHIECSDRSGKHKSGVWTDGPNKEQMVHLLNQSLAENSLVFARAITGSAPERDRIELIKQLEMYRKDVKEPLDLVRGTTRISYSGKSPGVKDDLAMTLQICLYWSQRKIRDTRYIATMRSC